MAVHMSLSCNIKLLPDGGKAWQLQPDGGKAGQLQPDGGKAWQLQPDGGKVWQLLQMVGRPGNCYRWWEGLVTRMCNISLAVTFIVNNTREIITSTLIPHSLYVHTAVGYPSFTAH